MRAVRTDFESIRSGLTALQPLVFARATRLREATIEAGLKNTASAEANSAHRLPGCSRISAHSVRAIDTKGSPNHMKNAANAGAYAMDRCSCAVRAWR